MNYNPDDISTWPCFKPLIIAHDVGHTRDRSTAVVGGNSPFGRPLLGIAEAKELQQGLFGHARARALAAVLQSNGNNGLIVADLSNDESYAEVLHEWFGSRVIGLRISSQGNGMDAGWWQVKTGAVPVYTIGRTYLIESFHTELQGDRVRLAKGPDLVMAYQQLATLEAEYRPNGTVYSCPAGHHDDLAISCAMLSWAARHPHLERVWLRNLQNALRPRKPREKFNWAAVT
ncbi:MAG: hypothetical protein ACRD3W_02775 [Terriglobales bacterium]